jgi:hypothetical protein
VVPERNRAETRAAIISFVASLPASALPLPEIEARDHVPVASGRWKEPRSEAGNDAGLKLRAFQCGLHHLSAADLSTYRDRKPCGHSPARPVETRPVGFVAVPDLAEVESNYSEDCIPIQPARDEVVRNDRLLLKLKELLPASARVSSTGLFDASPPSGRRI